MSERCRALFQDRPLILVADVIEQVLPISQMIEWSNGRVLEVKGVSTSNNDGSLVRVVKDVDSVPQVVIEFALDEKPTSAEWNAALAHPEVVAQIEAIDPDKRARVIAHTNVAVAPVAGRPVFGGRRENSLDFEKKLHFNAICDELEILRPQSTISGSSAPELLGHLAIERPTVWAHDANEFTSGGRGVRFMHPDMDPSVHSEFVDARGYVRISEFLPGPSCSVSAFVAGETVHVMPPVEQIVGATPFGQLFTIGISSIWLPSSVVRVQMSRAIRLLADKLRKEIDYAGSVIIDGIVSEGTFFATEINTRRGESARHISGLIDFDLRLLHLLALAGETEGVEVGRLGYKAARASMEHGYASAQLPIRNPEDVTEPIEEQFFAEGLNVSLKVEGGLILFRGDPTFETNRAQPVADLVVGLMRDFAGRHNLQIDMVGTPENLALAAMEGRLRTA